MNLYDDPNIQAKCVKFHNQGLSHEKIAQKLNIGHTTVYKALKAHRECNPAPVDEFELSHDYEEDKIGLFVLSPRIKTPEAALERAGLNPDDWEIVKCLIKTWEMGCKIEGTNHHGHKFTRGIAVEPLYGLTVHCKRRKGYSPNIFLDRFRDAVRASKRYIPRNRRSQRTSDYTVVLSIPDSHFGKLAWSDTSNDDYTLDIARQRYVDAVGFLLEEASMWEPSEIIYVIGNDALHVDNGKSQTTKGTYVESDSKWQDAYIQLAGALKDSINMVKEYAPTKVCVVPGNHDEEKMFTMGHAVGWLYEDDPSVDVDWSPLARKYVGRGQNLWMFEHGHNMAKDIKSIGHLMASEQPELWSKSRYREVITGHWHHKKDRIVESMQVDTIKDVVVRFLPSLSGTDEWHYKHGYINVKAAEAHIYHQEDGHCGMLEYRL